MRTLSLIHFPTFGGPHNRNAAVIPGLRGRGIETTVVLPSEPGNAVDKMTARGVTVVTLPLTRLRAVRDPRAHVEALVGMRRNIRELRSLIRALNVDVVLVNGLANPQGAIAAHLEGRAVVWQILDSYSPMALRRALMPVVGAIADVIMSSGFAIAVEHPGAVEFGERLIPFFSIVDPVKFENSAEKRALARQKLGLPEDALVVGNVNNVNPMKGHDTFIRAAKLLRDRHPDARFVILGAESLQHASLSEELRGLAGQLGLQIDHDLIIRDPDGEVDLLAAAFDIFWLTSNPRSEGVSTVVGEAMALELPIVATRVGAVQEAVADGVTGTLTPPLDPPSIADATLPYAESAELRREVGRAGRERALELYSERACVDRHERAYKLAIDYRRRRRA